MKIKIIDLLVKRANGEELPKKIRYKGKEWKYTSTVRGTGYQYYSDCYKEWKTLQQQVYLEEHLNNELEIIEEPKKIEHCLKRDRFLCDKDEMEHLRTKIDEIIDEINNLKEK